MVIRIGGDDGRSMVMVMVILILMVMVIYYYNKFHKCLNKGFCGGLTRIS